MAKEERSDIRSQNFGAGRYVGRGCSFTKTGHDQDMCVTHRPFLLGMNLLVGCGS